MIPPLERIAAFAVQIKAGATGHKKTKTLLIDIVFPLDEVFPFFVFVQFIEDDQTLVAGPRSVDYFPAVIAIVPVQIGTIGKMVRNELPGHCRFSDLSRSADKNHFSIIEIGKYRRHQVTIEHSGTPEKRTVQDFFRVLENILCFCFVANI